MSDFFKLFDETIRRSKQVNQAIALIRRAAKCGVLYMPDEEHVALIHVDESGEEKWYADNLLEAAIDLLNSGYLQELEKIVEERTHAAPGD